MQEREFQRHNELDQQKLPQNQGWLGPLSPF